MRAPPASAPIAHPSAVPLGFALPPALSCAPQAAPRPRRGERGLHGLGETDVKQMDEGSVRRAIARFGGMGWPRRASRGAGCDGAGREDGALETAAQRTCALTPKARARRRADERRRIFFYDPQLCVSRENPRFALSFVRSRSCGKCFGFGEAARSAAENFCARWASIV